MYLWIIPKEIKELDTKKVAQQDDIPGKILKSNNDILSQYLSQIFNENIETANFLNKLEYANITQIYKKKIDTKRRIKGPLVLYLLYQKY